MMAWSCMIALGPIYAYCLLEKSINSNLHQHALFDTTYFNTLFYSRLHHEHVMLFLQPNSTSCQASDFIIYSWTDEKGMIYRKYWTPSSPDLDSMECFWRQIKPRLEKISQQAGNI